MLPYTQDGDTIPYIGWGARFRHYVSWSVPSLPQKLRECKRFAFENFVNNEI